MPQTITFAPSGTPATFTAPDAVAASFAMPTVDGSNLDVTIQNNSISPVWFGFGSRAPTSAGFDTVVQPGQTVLFTANAAVQAANHSLVVAIGTQLSGAVSIMAVAQQRGGTVTITRGTATALPVF